MWGQPVFERPLHALISLSGLRSEAFFQALWHTWTPVDEEYLQRVVLPVIRADSWRCTTDITTYIFSVYRGVASNRTELHQWTAAYTWAYNRGLGF